jgi:hypothetical protein
MRNFKILFCVILIFTSCKNSENISDNKIISTYVTNSVNLKEFSLTEEDFDSNIIYKMLKNKKRLLC